MIAPLNLLDHIIETDGVSLAPELAKYILSLRFSPQALGRYDTLSAKAQAGALSDDEGAELDGLLREEAFLATLQSRARLSLKTHNSAA